MAGEVSGGKRPNVLMLISGGESGGSRKHVLSVLERLSRVMEAELVCLMPGPVYEEAAAKGLPVSLLPQSSRRDLGVVAALVRRLAEKGVTHLHSHGGRANFIAALARRKWQKAHPGRPLVWLTTVHSDIRRDYIHHAAWKRWLFTGLNRWALRQCDHFIAVSRAFAEQLEADGIPAEKISVVYNGIDMDTPVQGYTRDELAAIAGLDLDEHDQVVAAVGRLHPVKEIPVFLAAVAKLVAEGRPVKALLIGDGPERERLSAWVREQGLEARVAFLGFRSDVEPLLAAADVSVLTSRSESFPFVILESLKAGTLAVATAVGGIPDLLPSECLFAPGDVDGLCRRLRRWLDAPEERQAQVARLQARIRAEFSLQALADKHVQIYNRIRYNRIRP